MSKPTVRLLAQSRDNAHALFIKASGNSKNADAAQCLLELALYATSLVDDLHRALNPEGIREASKYYEEFPILASSVRRANKQQLDAVYSLPLGEKRPFKSAANEVGPATKWNDVRDVILRHAYPKFERVRNGAEELDVSAGLARQIRELPPIARAEAAKWARLFAVYFSEGAGFSELAKIVGSPDRTKKRNVTKQKSRLRTRYGGDTLVSQTEAGKARFYATSDGNDAPLTELDAIEGTELQTKSAKVGKNMSRPPSPAEELDSLTNAFFDCLKSILKV
jgi:hypothetical protein